jgi:hypothetical protein
MIAGRREALAAALLAVAVGAAAALSTQQVGDYAFDAGPAVESLLDGRLGEVLDETRPSSGLLPLLLGAPLAAAAEPADLLGEYRLFVLPATLAAGLLGAAVGLLALPRAGWAAALVAGALCAANPLVFDALRWGHPEDLLAGALAVGSVVAAATRRPVLSGALLGLAVGTEVWALGAAPAALLACESGRPRLLVPALACAALLALPAAIASTGSNGGSGSPRTVLPSSSNVLPTSVWWPVVRGDALATGPSRLGRRLSERFYPAPPWLRGTTRLLTAGILAALLLAAVWRRGTRWGMDALALLALMMLVATMLHPAPFGYTLLPLLLALTSWEALARGRLPLVSAALAAALWLTFVNETIIRGSDTRVYAFTLAWALPCAAYLAYVCLAPAGRSAGDGAALAVDGVAAGPLRQ